MRLTTTILIAAASVVAATPAHALRIGYHADADIALDQPITSIAVSVDPEAVNERLRLNRHSRGDQSFLGPNDAEDLVEDLHEALVHRLGERNLVAENAGYAGPTLEVVILNADPTNLALTEVGQRNFLDPASIGRGGATVEATLTSADGAVLSTYRYRYTEPGTNFYARAGVWSEAQDTFDRFARQLADDLAE